MTDFAVQRTNMVESQVRTSDVTDRRIIRAMMALPRELFLPGPTRALAYSEGDVPILYGDRRSARHLVAPRTLAKLIQLADIAALDRVLVVGCATGYAVAVIAELGATVIGLEPDPDLITVGQQYFASAKSDRVTLVQGALPAGHAWAAPFDVIFLDSSVPVVPATLFDQLGKSGRLVGIIARQSGAGDVGTAMIYRKVGATVSGRAAFDASAPALPGFDRPAQFAF